MSNMSVKKVEWICNACGHKFMGLPRSVRKTAPRCPNEAGGKKCASRRVMELIPEDVIEETAQIEEVAPLISFQEIQDEPFTPPTPEELKRHKPQIPKRKLTAKEATALRKRSTGGTKDAVALIYNLIVFIANTAGGKTWSSPTQAEIDKTAEAWLNTKKWETGAVGVVEKMPTAGVVIAVGQFMLKRIMEPNLKDKKETKNLNETELPNESQSKKNVENAENRRVSGNTGTGKSPFTKVFGGDDN